MFGSSSGLFSNQPRGFPQEVPPSQRSSLSRPSAKSIYMQRKEYSETMNKQPDNFQYTVEHLFTHELDGQEVRSLDDCVARLQRLEAKGRVWGQEMILEVQGGCLHLIDIETKAELESVPLGCVVQTKAVLDSCAYNSLLIIMVQQRNRRIPQVFMLQCEEVGAEAIREDLDKAVQHNANAPPPEPRRDRYDIRSNLENVIGQQANGKGFRPVDPPPLYGNRNDRAYESFPPPPVYSPQQQPLYSLEMYRGSQQYGARDQAPPQPQPQYTDTERSVEVLNHVLNDVELFMGKVSGAVPNEDKKKKKKKKKMKNSPKQNADNSPHWEEFVACLQKIKYGFNLLGKLNGEIQNPSAPDFVHFLFSTLDKLVAHCPPDLPPSVLTPLLTEPALTLLSQVVTPEEDRLWRALGDSWNLPRSKWPDGHMIPPYHPEFYDGWQLPMPVPPAANQGLSRSNSQHFLPREEMMQQMPDEGRSNSHYIQRPEEPMMNSPPPSQPMMNSQWNSPPPSQPMMNSQWNSPPPSQPMMNSPPPSQPMMNSQWNSPPPSHPMMNSQWNSPPPSQPMMNSPPPSQPMMNSQWNSPPTSHEPAPVRMRVIYDFVARNHQELSIMKGEVVQVVDKSGQWWRVRNERGEEGHVAKNVLEPLDGGEPWDEGQEVRSPPALNMHSSPADVKAWLEYKSFSKITVRSLAVLNGALLLGMSRDEMRTVCPEEGGRVFFQLQAIKSSIALASESNDYGPYNGR
ncbi:epidermal growth factor receptor kinase substrate 8-like protein 3 [Coregonus clupeaformis]|uniref:epidermal growth factor receptor kinase substrate 8-like protein 3 n=1 Tax=Coregonus clupeaformis TaxID=59861 RepID=UPI001E1C3397|nr:epidermal growth factor receptor kinase substrate 8-like protein 3 [Coregonus clupeaformis]